MRSLLWTLLKVTAAVVLAVKVLRDFQKTVDLNIKPEEKESTRERQLPDAQNNDDGNP